MKKFTLIIIVIITSLFLSSCEGIHTEETNDINDYGNWKNAERFCDLSVFPINIMNEEIEEYYYYFKQVIFNPSYTIYLKCHYTEENYELEVDRIREVFNYMEGYNKKYVYYTEEEFSYPAYVSCYNGYNEFFEYALLDDDNNTIIYIMIQYKNTKISFDEEYLPKDYYNDITKEYSIYIFSKEDKTKDTNISEVS